MEEFHLVVGLDISRKIPAQHRDDAEPEWRSHVNIIETH